MNKQPLVSILMLTADHHAAYVREAIESALAQTAENWELVILDDGPTYAAGEVLRSYRDRRITYDRQPHAGPEHIALSYNRMLAKTRGELIAILEGDDRWPADKLEAQVHLMNHDTTIVLSYGLAEVIDGAGNFMNQVPGQEARQRRDWLFNSPVGSAAHGLLVLGMYIPPISTMIRSHALRKVGGFRHVEGLYTTDTPTFFDLAFQGEFGFLPQVLGYWRRHSKNLSVRKSYDLALGSMKYFLDKGFQNGGSHLTDCEAELVEGRWDTYLATCHLINGRYYLARGRFTEAAFHFKKLLATHSLRYKARGLLGITASQLALSNLYEDVCAVFHRPNIWSIRDENIDGSLLQYVEQWVRAI